MEREGNEVVVIVVGVGEGVVVFAVGGHHWEGLIVDVSGDAMLRERFDQRVTFRFVDPGDTR